jgi:cytochrome c2
MKSRPVALAILFLAASVVSGRALELHADRASPFDLALRGELAGVPAGATRYARWADLRALPTTKLNMNGEFVDGPQTLTVVFLEDLWKALPVAPGADCILATCADGYASVLRSDFILKYRPFLVLEINGKGPVDWPPPGLDFNPGPFVITESADLVPSVAIYRDVEHKKPWGVTTVEIATYAERYRAIYSGRWASLSPAASDGRDIWVNSCASCHAGPDGIFGGTKAGRPFEVIAAYAGYARAFFVKYVRDPKSLVPCAKMEPHPHYSDEELSELISFITAGTEGPAGDKAAK